MAESASGMDTFSFTRAFLAAQAGTDAVTGAAVLEYIERHGLIKLRHFSDLLNILNDRAEGQN